MHYMYKNSVKQ